MKLFKVLFIMLFSFCCMVFANAVSTVANDSLGQVSQQLVDVLSKVFGNDGALALYGSICILVVTGIQNLLKQLMKHWVKTKYGKYGKFAYPLIMRILSQKWLLGPSILRYKSEFDPNLSAEEKEEVAAKIRDEVKEEIRKKYPMFQIEIGNTK